MSRPAFVVLSAALLAAASCQRVPLMQGREDQPPAPAAQAPHTPRLLSGLGSHSRSISTRSELAQRYFDQGLVLTYGFNHGGAIDAFREAARQDPDCAMCFWGVAYAYGPNINAPMGPEAATAAYAALQEARRRLPHASPVEREYIEALSARYAPDPQPADRSALDAAYAEAMRGVHQRHPDDLDAAALFAEALMDQHPWDYWTEDGTPREGTLEAAATIDAVLEKNPWHPGANHFQIHIYEEFQPERAEAAADRLASIAPDAGHLVHMPAHIYWRVGRYQDAWRVNELAAASDVAYLTWCRTQPFYAALYLNHNLHFLWAAAAAEGRSDEAITAARRLAASVPAHKLAEVPPLEDFLTVPIVTLVRFGRFDAALAEPKPPAEQRYRTAFWHYARGVAFARLGRAAEAEGEAAALAEIAADPTWETTIWVEGPLARRFEVAEHHLAGEIAAARRDPASAVTELEAAVAAQDALNYTEPPAFYFPTRQALGAVLLDAGRAKEAEAVYRRDLEQYPKNGWSLFGLSRALAAQRKTSEARWASQGFERAWQRADVKLAASRF
jgi:tetratricopeptide (TPR) repeat protein